MAQPRGPAEETRWWRRALCVGLTVSLPVPIIILASQLLDALHFAYPLCVLPLLLAGPVAVRRGSGRAAIATAALAGAISAVFSSASVALGLLLTFFMQWG